MSSRAIIPTPWLLDHLRRVDGNAIESGSAGIVGDLIREILRLRGFEVPPVPSRACHYRGFEVVDGDA